MLLFRDRSGARRGSGAGGEGDDPNGNVAPRDGAYGKGAANIGNTGSGAIDEGNMEFNMNAIDLSDMKVCGLATNCCDIDLRRVINLSGSFKCTV